MSLIRKLYRVWVWSCFIIVFFTLLPFFYLFAQKESWKIYGHYCNKIWAYTVFGFCFLPTKIIRHYKPSANKQYVYCANHNSYLDIPSLCYCLPGYFMFIGKASLAKVPLFGFMFRNYYIPVDRHSAKSKANTIKLSLEALDKGRSLGVFPEGTIPRDHNPHMITFKDGAFRAAIEKQIPIVPVTIPYNWLILPDDGKYVPNRMLMKVIIHQPITTEGLTMDDLENLKEQTRRIIDHEIWKQINLLDIKTKERFHLKQVEIDRKLNEYES